jgi:hypothetical protein
LSVVAVVAVALAGCGGSASSSANRSQLIGKLSTGLAASAVPPDLSACITQQAQGLPLAQLQSLSAASSSSNASPATRQVAARLISTCVNEGKGVSALRRGLVGSIIQQAPANLPLVFTNCLVAKAGAVSAGTLATLIGYATQNQATAQQQARQVGVGLAAQCFDEPGVVDALRPSFIAELRSGMASTSVRFQNCVVAKAERLSNSQLKQMILDPNGPNSGGQKFGRSAAAACIAAGQR